MTARAACGRRRRTIRCSAGASARSRAVGTRRLRRAGRCCALRVPSGYVISAPLILRSRWSSSSPQSPSSSRQACRPRATPARPSRCAGCAVCRGMSGLRQPTACACNAAPSVITAASRSRRSSPATNGLDRGVRSRRSVGAASRAATDGRAPATGYAAPTIRRGAAPVVRGAASSRSSWRWRRSGCVTRELSSRATCGSFLRRRSTSTPSTRRFAWNCCSACRTAPGWGARCRRTSSSAC